MPMNVATSICQNMVMNHRVLLLRWMHFNCLPNTMVQLNYSLQTHFKVVKKPSDDLKKNIC